MAGLKFTFTGDNQDVLKKINQIQTELKKVYNNQKKKIDLSAGVDFSLLGENFKRLDQQSREAFDNMSKDAQKYVKEIQQNILSLQQVEKMQAGLNSLYEDGDIDLNAYIQSQARLTVLHEELAKGINESRAALEAETTTTKIAEDSIAGLHAKVLMLTTDYMNLSKAQREGTEGAALLKNLQETQTQMDNASLSMNKYASGAKTRFDALGFSITQIARELPSLAMGPQMFFLAISNNIGPFQDVLAAARKEYQDMVKAGQKGIPVWKQLLSSLKGSGPILAVVTTLFVTFGDDIIKWVGTLFKAKKAVDDLKESQKVFSEALNEGSKNAQQDITRLQLLYKAAIDTARGQEERNKAVKELQKEYPDYFKNLDAEAIKNGTAQQSYENLAASILKAAQARAVESRIAENKSKTIDLETQINEAYKGYEEAQNKLKELIAERDKIDREAMPDLYASAQMGIGAQLGRIKSMENEAAELRTELYQLNKQSQELANSVSAIDLTFNAGDDSDEDTGAEDVNAYSDRLHRIAELRSKSSRERIRLEVELANQEEQARIDAMQDGFEKEERQRKLNNKMELESIERQRQDYINKVVDIQRQIFEAEEDAKLSKDKSYKKQTFNPSSVSVDTSVFDIIKSETLKKQTNDLTEYYDDLLSKYQDYTTKRLNAEKRFNRDREKLEKSGASDAQLNELEYQRTETLNSIDQEFAMREESFQSWANSIADLSLKELQRLLAEAERELERTEFLTPGSEGLATQRAKVNALKQQIGKANKNTTSPDKRSEKEWKSLYKVLSKVEEEFDKIGNTVGGTAGEILSAAGSITSSTLQMIDGITLLAESSAKAMEGTAKAASSAITTVEKASVVLAIIGAALQVATKITSLFDDSEAQQKRYEEYQRRQEGYWQAINYQTERYLELLKEAAANDYFEIAGKSLTTLEDARKKAYEDIIQSMPVGDVDHTTLGLVQLFNHGKFLDFRQYPDAKEIFDFINANGGYDLDNKLISEEAIWAMKNNADIWSKLPDWMQQAIDKFVELNDQAKDLEETLNKDLFQATSQSIEEAILEGLKGGKRGIADFGEDFEEIMRNALLQSFVIDQLRGKAQEFYKKYTLLADSDNNGKLDLTAEEISDLRKDWNDIIRAATEEAKNIDAIVGGSSSSSQESSKKGFGTEMTHEDAGELRGRFTALQIAGEESKNQLMLLNQVTDALLSVNEAGNATLNNMLYQQVLTNSYLEDITKYTKALQEMKNDLAAVKNNTAGLARR